MLKICFLLRDIIFREKVLRQLETLSYGRIIGITRLLVMLQNVISVLL